MLCTRRQDIKTKMKNIYPKAAKASLSHLLKSFAYKNPHENVIVQPSASPQLHSSFQFSGSSFSCVPKWLIIWRHFMLWGFSVFFCWSKKVVRMSSRLVARMAGQSPLIQMRWINGQKKAGFKSETLYVSENLLSYSVWHVEYSRGQAIFVLKISYLTSPMHS